MRTLREKKALGVGGAEQVQGSQVNLEVPESDWLGCVGRTSEPHFFGSSSLMWARANQYKGVWLEVRVGGGSQNSQHHLFSGPLITAELRTVMNWGQKVERNIGKVEPRSSLWIASSHDMWVWFPCIRLLVVFYMWWHGIWPIRWTERKLTSIWTNWS